MLGSFCALFFQILAFVFPASFFCKEWLNDESCHSAFRTRFLSQDIQKTIKCKSTRTKNTEYFCLFFSSAHCRTFNFYCILF